MFHRKMKRQIIHYGRGLPGEAKQEWIHANRLKEEGQYAEAAAVFERLAHAAHKRGMVERTARLLLDAAHSWLLAGDPTRGYPLLRQGLDLLHAQGKWLALRRTGEFAIAELERLGNAQAAHETQAWLEQVLADQPPAPPAPASGQTPPGRLGFRLPAKCPSCGERLRPDEASWIDENHVECPYCGSTVPLRPA
jgi:hypothetical protein